MLLNCGFGEDSWESLGQIGDPASPSERKSVLNIHWKDWYWSWNQYSDHLMRRTGSFEKTLMLGKVEGGRRRGLQRMRWLDGITNSMDMSLSKLGYWWWTGKPGVLQSMESQRARHNWVKELELSEALLFESGSIHCLPLPFGTLFQFKLNFLTLFSVSFNLYYSLSFISLCCIWENFRFVFQIINFLFSLVCLSFHTCPLFSCLSFIV